MSLVSQISEFHFLRPWWWLALLPALMLWWIIRERQDTARAWRGLIAEHLLPHLLTEQGARKSLTATHLLAFGWCVTILALAGPTWKLEPSPFAEDNAALAIVIKVTPSMKTADIQPDRLSRSVQKIHDLLALRRGAKTALIAYSGSAHIVMPITTDEGIIDTFAAALDPKIMPREGDEATAALKLADQVLAENGTGGSILWITDGSAPEEQAALAAWRKASGTPVRILAPLLAGPELDLIKTTARSMEASVIPLTPDEADVGALARAARYSSATDGEPGRSWQESGYWLTPFIALLMLPFFRRGWLVPTAAS